MIRLPGEIPGLALLEVSYELACEILDQDRPSCPSPGLLVDGTRAAVAYRTSVESVDVVGTVRVTRAYPAEAVVLRSDNDDDWGEGSVAVRPEHDPGRRGLWVLGDRVRIAPTPAYALQTHSGVPWLHLADADVAEALASGVTAQTVWEYLRLQRPLDGVYARAPEWAGEWIDDLAGELQASVDKTLREVLQAWDEDPDAQAPGPYRDHLVDLANHSHPRMIQRIWATYRPGPELPERM